MGSPWVCMHLDLMCVCTYKASVNYINKLHNDIANKVAAININNNAH